MFQPSVMSKLSGWIVSDGRQRDAECEKQATNILAHEFPDVKILVNDESGQGEGDGDSETGAAAAVIELQRVSERYIVAVRFRGIRFSMESDENLPIRPWQKLLQEVVGAKYQRPGLKLPPVSDDAYDDSSLPSVFGLVYLLADVVSNWYNHSSWAPDRPLSIPASPRLAQELISRRAKPDSLAAYREHCVIQIPVSMQLEVEFVVMQLQQNIIVPLVQDQLAIANDWIPITTTWPPPEGMIELQLKVAFASVQARYCFREQLRSRGSAMLLNQRGDLLEPRDLEPLLQLISGCMDALVLGGTLGSHHQDWPVISLAGRGRCHLPCCCPHAPRATIREAPSTIPIPPPSNNESEPIEPAAAEESSGHAGSGSGEGENDGDEEDAAAASGGEELQQADDGSKKRPLTVEEAIEHITKKCRLNVNLQLGTVPRGEVFLSNQQDFQQRLDRADDSAYRSTMASYIHKGRLYLALEKAFANPDNLSKVLKKEMTKWFERLWPDKKIRTRERNMLISKCKPLAKLAETWKGIEGSNMVVNWALNEAKLETVKRALEKLPEPLKTRWMTAPSQMPAMVPARAIAPQAAAPRPAGAAAGAAIAAADEEWIE